jgi:hypothetical protein
LSKDAVVTVTTGDSGQTAAMEPPERRGTVAPHWDGISPQVSPAANRGDYCADYWPPL